MIFNRANEISNEISTFDMMNQKLREEIEDQQAELDLKVRAPISKKR